MTGSRSEAVESVEHQMRLESMELVEKDIELKNRSLVGKDRRVLHERKSEYVCSCGERFDTGVNARNHLLENTGEA